MPPLDDCASFGTSLGITKGVLFIKAYIQVTNTKYCIFLQQRPCGLTLMLVTAPGPNFRHKYLYSLLVMYSNLG